MTSELVLLAEEAFGPEADLDPELEARLITMREGMVCIKHPLVNELFYHPRLNHRYNMQLQHKRQLLDAAKISADWVTFIYLHERPWRLDALQEAAPNMDDEVYWANVAHVWIDSENIRENQDEWEALLRSKRPGKQFMMDDEDRELLAAMPYSFKVYQGRTDERDDGWSWTTSIETATWFAHRFASMEDAVPSLQHGEVFKHHVLAYLTGRNEHEIIADPQHINHTGYEILVPQ